LHFAHAFLQRRPLGGLPGEFLFGGFNPGLPLVGFRPLLPEERAGGEQHGAED